MKKEVSPAVFAVVIVVAVLLIGAFIFKQANSTPPTPRPDPKFFGVPTNGSQAQQPSATPAQIGK